jgi:RNA-directed DNA polymerase
VSKNISHSILLYDSCEELSKKFKELKSPRDVARLLEVPFGDLNYYLYRKSEDSRYKTFIVLVVLELFILLINHYQLSRGN